MTKWIVLLAILGTIFYLGRTLLPSGNLIDVQWMRNRVHIGMSKEEVRAAIGGDPTDTIPTNFGKNESWYYEDQRDPNLHLVIQFANNRVINSVVQHESVIKSGR